MKEIKFKVLMYMGVFADALLLEKGIYGCTKPYIYSMDETMDTAIEKARKFQHMVTTGFITETYFENLKQCELVPVVIMESKALEDIRTAFADYRASEGVNGNYEAHHEANLTLAKLLDAKMTKDASAVDWGLYQSKPWS